MAEHLRRFGFETETEVWVGDRHIDLLGWRPHPRRLVSVEAKVDRWKAGLRQANLARLCSDYSYLAIARHALGNVDLQRLADVGIGLFAVDGTVEEILPPTYSRVKHPTLYLQAMRPFGR